MHEANRFGHIVIKNCGKAIFIAGRVGGGWGLSYSALSHTLGSICILIQYFNDRNYSKIT